MLWATSQAEHSHTRPACAHLALGGAHSSWSHHSSMTHGISGHPCISEALMAWYATQVQASLDRYPLLTRRSPSTTPATLLAGVSSQRLYFFVLRQGLTGAQASLRFLVISPPASAS